MKLEKIKLDDGTLYHVYTYGDKKNFPLFLIHGNNQNHLYFFNIIRNLEKKFFLIIPDMRGNGKTKNKANYLNFDLYSSDIRKIVSYFKIKKMNVLGFSDGANSAIDFQLKYPDFIQNLVVISPNVFSSGIKKIIRIIDNITIKTIEFILNKISKKTKKKHYINTLEKLNILNLNVIKNWYDLEKIKNNVLIIGADFDLIKRSHMKHIHEHIFGSKFIIVRMTFHNTILIVQKNKTLKLINNFLSK